jgi:hypothetical protein
MIYLINERLRNLNGVSLCSNPVTDTKIQILPNLVFIKDEFSWNADNDPTTNKCPSQFSWYLNSLDQQINNSPSSIPTGINMYFTNQGLIYDQLVTIGSISQPPNDGTYCKVWCSEQPTAANLNRTSRIHIPNLYLKYRWFQKYAEANNQPFADLRWIILNEIWNGIPHELGHSLINSYVHYLGCSNHLMNPVPGKSIRAKDVGEMHRNLSITNLRRFVECDETLNQPSGQQFDRYVDMDETWDLNIRLYQNVVVKTGTTLKITCQVLMPENGTITVQRGAKLIVDGGKIIRANTCTPAQFWGGIYAHGNNSLAQADASGTVNTNQGGVVVLTGDGMIEGAIIGVATKAHPLWDVPEYRGALVDARFFTFKDCRKGVEFMKYDFVNKSKFSNVVFERTSTGSMHTGVSIWDTDGIRFDSCSFINMNQNGIRAGDASFHVRRKNYFRGSEVAILAGASAPLSSKIKVGEEGATFTNRNKFEKNVVGCRMTADSWVDILNNDFSSYDFEVALNGPMRSVVSKNVFSGSTAGTQFENTGIQTNQGICNQYNQVIVGTNIVGDNSGYFFRGEDFNTKAHDLFLEGPASNPGKIRMNQGGLNNARFNYFSANNTVTEQIKTSTVVPNNFTQEFLYFHPDPSLDVRLKPKCANNDNCTPQSNFKIFQTVGSDIGCPDLPSPPPDPGCVTKECLEEIRILILQKLQSMGASPTTQQTNELDLLFSERERIMDVLIDGMREQNNWIGIENLLEEDLNPYNLRRKVGAKIARNQYTAAQQVLQTFQQTTQDDQYFVTVQNINISRLSNPAFVLSSEQENTLTSIALAPSKEAGYAQTLLGITKGVVFMPKVPRLDIETDRSMPSASSEHKSLLSVIPNPVNTLLTVQLPATLAQHVSWIQLQEMSTGKVVFMRELEPGIEYFEVETSKYPSGIYLLVWRPSTEQQQQHQKIVIQH